MVRLFGKCFSMSLRDPPVFETCLLSSFPQSLPGNSNADIASADKAIRIPPNPRKQRLTVLPLASSLNASEARVPRPWYPTAAFYGLGTCDRKSNARIGTEMRYQPLTRTLMSFLRAKSLQLRSLPRLPYPFPCLGKRFANAVMKTRIAILNFF